MKVLMVHNRYQQRGGEDAVVDAEVRLLAANGIEVQRFDADNDAIQGLVTKIQVSLGQFGLPTAAQSRFKNSLFEFRPDVVHVHNWFPTLSPSLFNICSRENVPVVHTLHNYRLLCVNATLFRDGNVCEDCIGTTFRTPGILHSCYRGSTVGSAVATAGMLTHWSIGTWSRSINRFVALTEFARHKLLEGGLPADKVVVKPNFIDPDPGPGAGRGGYFLFAGRLTEEKGIRVLLECWKHGQDLPKLKIAGTGPLENEVRAAVSTMPNVEWLGARSSDEVIGLMADASALLCPSQWYEGMPRVVIESLAVGTPIIASRIGCYPEMIVDGETGALFPAGDALSLRSSLRDLLQHNSLCSMRGNARGCFQSNYTGDKNFSTLLNVYRSVLKSRELVQSRAVPAGT
ncbi:glycosyltransferase family 4 protein [Telmatobacter sp. DSM 110680]|uniref:Glycosyltransferase family 4 protein n=1 Tax=Telmatobacter sp. DSM 110680 TaxID=3036704 RepID=A0AAU7DEI7_9BACT